MSPAIVTFLVTHHDSPLFRSALDAALAQDIPHTIIVVDASPAGQAKAAVTQHPQRTHLHYVRTPAAANFAQALSDAVNDVDIREILSSATYYWFLHHDSLATPSTLREELAVMESGSSVAVVGPKHHGPNGEIYEVGITATRGGRRVETALPDELDQGQYDGRSDVLAVGSAGLLVTASLWHEVRGFSRLVSPYNDGLEFCRRIRRAGYRVLVAPKAVLTHHRQSLTDTTRSLLHQRRSRMNMTTLATPWWHLPFYLLFFALIQPLRALAALAALNLPQAAAEMIVYLAWLIDIPALLKRKASGRLSARVPRSALTTVETPWRALWQRRNWEKKRIERIGGVETNPLLLDAIHRHRRRYWAALGALMALTGLCALVVWGPFLGGTEHLQNIVTGPSWAGLPYHWAQLWQAALTPTGSHGTYLSDPLIALAAALGAPLAAIGVGPATAVQLLWVAALPAAAGAMWWASSVLTPRLGLRLMAALLWAGQPALTVSLMTGQMGAALFHVTVPVALAASLRMLGARYDYELAAESAPVVYQRHHHRRWWGITAIVYALLVAAVPGSLVLIVAALAFITVIAYRRPLWSIDRVGLTSVRAHIASAWGSIIPATILAGPFLAQVTSHGAWPVLLAPVGPATVGRGFFEGQAYPHALMLGLPAGHLPVTELSGGTVPLLAALTLAWVLVILLAASRLSTLIAGTSTHRPHRVWVTIAGIAVGTGALASALAAVRIPLHLYFPPWHQLLSAEDLTAQGATILGARLPALSIQAFTDAHHSVNLTVTPLLSIAACAFMLAYLMTVHSEGRAARVHAPIAAITAIALLAVAGISATAQWPERAVNNLSYGNAYSLPIAVLDTHANTALTAEQDTHNQRARDILLVIPTPQGLYLQRMTGNGELLTDSSALERYERLHAATPHGGAVQTLEQAVATLIVAPDAHAVRTLSAAGIDSIALLRLTTPENTRFADQLAQTPGVEPGAQTHAMELWRLRPIAQNHPLTPSTPSSETPDGTRPVPALDRALSSPWAHQIRMGALALTLTLAALWSIPLPGRPRARARTVKGQSQ